MSADSSLGKLIGFSSLKLCVTLTLRGWPLITDHWSLTTDHFPLTTDHWPADQNVVRKSRKVQLCCYQKMHTFCLIVDTTWSKFRPDLNQFLATQSISRSPVVRGWSVGLLVGRPLWKSDLQSIKWLSKTYQCDCSDCSDSSEHNFFSPTNSFSKKFQQKKS